MNLTFDKSLILTVGAGALIGIAGMFAANKLLSRGRAGHSKWASSGVKDYCYSHTNLAESEALRGLRELTAGHPWGIMESSPDVGQFLVFLVRTIKAKKIIEVGSFTGVALLRMAEELPQDGRIFALDIESTYTDLGKPYLEQAGVLDKVDYRIAPALESLVQLKGEGHLGTVDLCFIDADKANYPSYYKLCYELLRPGGILVFDNSLYGGRLVTDKTSNPNCFIHETNEKASVDGRVTSILMCIGDGCLVLRKND